MTQREITQYELSAAEIKAAILEYMHNKFPELKLAYQDIELLGDGDKFTVARCTSVKEKKGV